MSKIIEIKVYITNIEKYEDADSFEKAYTSVDIERRKKIDSFKFQKSKLQSLAAGVLLNQALEDAGFDRSNVKFRYNEYGKPYIEDLPIFFNLSHSGNYAMCVVSDCEVGCDIEEIKSAEDKLAKRFFREEEYQDINSQENFNERKDLFYRYWTLKESFMKATGLGLKLPLNSFQIILGNKISIKQSVNDSEYSFYEISEIDGYKCAICVNSIQSKLLMKIL